MSLFECYKTSLFESYTTATVNGVDNLITIRNPSLPQTGPTPQPTKAFQPYQTFTKARIVLNGLARPRPFSVRAPSLRFSPNHSRFA